MNKLIPGAALIFVAAAVPLAAGYWLGEREAGQQIARLGERALADNRAEAEKLARRLADRLRGLRDIETQRPYYEYQAWMHDPRGVAQGIAIIPSPLAAGPADPLIIAHFQISPEGTLSLPALDEAVPETVPAARRERFLPVLERWRPAAQRLKALLPGLPTRAETEARPGGVRPTPGAHSEPPPRHLLEAQQSLILSANDWAQNRAAGALYLAAQRPEKNGRPAAKATIGGAKKTGEPVIIEASWLFWRSVNIHGQPGLFALRGVDTPDGRWVQGFQVDLTKARAELQEFSPAALTLDMKKPHAGGAAIEIGGAEWWIGRDEAPGRSAAQTAGEQLLTRFHRLFALIAAGVLLAALLALRLLYKAEQLAAARSRFAAAAAHELRTPLAGLRLYGEMLAEGHGDPAKQRDYARRVADEAARLARVVGNILEFTRLERGALRVNPRPGDLASALRDIAQRLEPGLREAGAPLVLALDEALPPVAFDADALHEIVQNLLDNGEKYSRGATDRTLTLGLRAAAGGAEISVSDRGPGVPEKLREKLFSPFYRADARDAPPGLGLGLALVRSLARAHGGRARCEENPGGGARFSVWMPH